MQNKAIERLQSYFGSNSWNTWSSLLNWHLDLNKMKGSYSYLKEERFRKGNYHVYRSWGRCVQGPGGRLVWVEPRKQGRKKRDETGQRDREGLVEAMGRSVNFYPRWGRKLVEGFEQRNNIHFQRLAECSVNNRLGARTETGNMAMKSMQWSGQQTMADWMRAVAEEVVRRDQILATV